MTPPPSNVVRTGLVVRFGLIFTLFVAAGSVFLLTWLHHQQHEEAQRTFLALAEADARFIREMNLPRSQRLAADLRRLVDMDIHFATQKEVIPPLPAEILSLLRQSSAREVRALNDGRQLTWLPLDADHQVVFIRQPPSETLSPWHPSTRHALWVFWLLSGLLGWFLARQILHPLTQLSTRLTDFFQNSTLTLPETQRMDEIGTLALALTQARDNLWLEKTRREQSERLAMLGRMTTGLAHEIKNPLASIRLHAELVDSQRLDTDSAASLHHVLEETRVIEGLVNQWLYLSKPSSARMEQLDLATLINDTLTTLTPQARHAGVQLQTLHSTAEKAHIIITGDRHRLHQAFRNLLLNSIQAMPKGGHLTVELHSGDFAPAPSSTDGPQSLGSCYEVFIRDTGPGFSPEALQRGTELFFSEKEGGMGVGLNVAHDILAAHKASLHIRNSAQGGAEVWLSFPKAAN